MEVEDSPRTLKTHHLLFLVTNGSHSNKSLSGFIIGPLKFEAYFDRSMFYHNLLTFNLVV